MSMELWEKAFDEWPGWRGNDPIRQAFQAGWDAAIASRQELVQLKAAYQKAISCIPTELLNLYFKETE